MKCPVCQFDPASPVLPHVKHTLPSRSRTICLQSSQSFDFSFFLSLRSRSALPFFGAFDRFTVAVFFFASFSFQCEKHKVLLPYLVPPQHLLGFTFTILIAITYHVTTTFTVHSLLSYPAYSRCCHTKIYVSAIEIIVCFSSYWIFIPV